MNQAIRALINNLNVSLILLDEISRECDRYSLEGDEALLNACIDERMQLNKDIRDLQYGIKTLQDLEDSGKYYQKTPSLN